jgi:hypothetical protein
VLIAATADLPFSLTRTDVGSYIVSGPDGLREFETNLPAAERLFHAFADVFRAGIRRAKSVVTGYREDDRGEILTGRNPRGDEALVDAIRSHQLTNAEDVIDPARAPVVSVGQYPYRREWPRRGGGR